MRTGWEQKNFKNSILTPPSPPLLFSDLIGYMPTQLLGFIATTNNKTQAQKSCTLGKDSRNVVFPATIEYHDLFLSILCHGKIGSMKMANKRMMQCKQKKIWTICTSSRVARGCLLLEISLRHHGRPKAIFGNK
jgi:hypothetical protein